MSSRQRSSIFEAALSSRLGVTMLRASLAAESLLMAALVFVSAHRRLHVPFSLDWVEEGNLIEVGRVAHHLPIYVPPTIHYTPYIYAPLFYWVAALVSHFVGVGYPAMRMVSIASTLGICAGVFLFVLGETPRHSPARWLAPLVSVGLFASIYSITEGFLDVGRVDMLCLFPAILGLYCVRREHLVTASLLFAVAIQAKQGFLPIAVLALCCDWQRPRRLLVGLGSLLVFCAIPVVWMTRATAGWYLLYVFKVAPGFKVDHRILLFDFPTEVAPVAAISLVVIAAGLLLTPPRRLDRASSFYLLTALGMVFYTLYVRAHAGAAGNANIPAFLWIAMTAGVCFERLYRRVAESQSWPAAATHGALMLLLIAPMLQMLLQLHGPAFWVPTSEDLATRKALVASLRSIPGDVLILDHSQYALDAGKTVYADGKAVDGLITSHGNPLGGALQHDFADLVHRQAFSAIVLDGDFDSVLADDRLPGDFLTYYPVRAHIGFNTRKVATQPSWIFLPCSAMPALDSFALLPGVPFDASRCPLNAR